MERGKERGEISCCDLVQLLAVQTAAVWKGIGFIQTVNITQGRGDWRRGKNEKRKREGQEKRNGKERRGGE